MSKQAVSVTLSPDNLLWLRTQAGVERKRSLSEALDQLILEARGASHGASRSVRGTIEIAEDDLDLAGADAGLRAVFTASLARQAPVPRSRPHAQKSFARARRKTAR